MKRKSPSMIERCALAFLISIATNGLACAADCSLEKVQWIAGAWRDAIDSSRGEERWVVVPGGALMGSSWLVSSTGKGFAEAMTISNQDNGVPAMRLRHFDLGLTHAWEERDAPMVFVATECGASSAVFSGIAARAGEKLSYERDGTSLNITGDFINNGVASRVVFRMVRAAD
jgi:hypothetical protein